MTEKIWVLTDDIIGHTNQSLVLARNLGEKFTEKKIYYNFLSFLPSFIIGASLAFVNKLKSDIEGSYPDIVISSGRKLALISRYIKKHSPNTKIIHILWPETGIDEFDLIILPSHDKYPDKYGNIINIEGSLTEINKDFLIQEKSNWKEKFKQLPSPLIAVFIGGDTKRGDFTENHAEELFEKITSFAKSRSCSLLVSTSRRTNKNVIKKIKDTIEVPYYFYDFASKAENPYLGFLAVADIIIATGDSISMCTDCAASGKGFYIYEKSDFVPEKHRNFIQKLYSKNYAKKIDDLSKYDQINKINTLDNLSIVIAEIKKILDTKFS